MKASTHNELKQTTIGELIVAVTEAALEATEDEEKAYEIASRVLVRLLETSAPGAVDELIAACGATVH